MAETYAAQIARLEERIAQAQREREEILHHHDEDILELKARIVALEAHDAEYRRILSLSHFGILILLGAGTLIAWLPGWINEVRRFIFGR